MPRCVPCMVWFRVCNSCLPGRKNSRTMLIPLLQRFPEQVRVSLFHTPNLRGLLKLLIPERFNETIGLQHIKVYLFDDNVILSGWVLSSPGLSVIRLAEVLMRGMHTTSSVWTSVFASVFSVMIIAMLFWYGRATIGLSHEILIRKPFSKNKNKTKQIFKIQKETASLCFSLVICGVWSAASAGAFRITSICSVLELSSPFSLLVQTWVICTSPIVRTAMFSCRTLLRLQTSSRS